MCGRYELNMSGASFAQRFALSTVPEAFPHIVLRPTNTAPVLTPGRDGFEVRLLKWGFAAPWDGKPLFNARAERLAQARTFRPFLGQRCLVPATAFFEWRALEQAEGEPRPRKPRKQMLRIARPDGDAFAMAGLFGADAEGRAAFTIVTCAPNRFMADIHSRMPVIFATDDDARAWTRPEAAFDAVAALLRPYEGELVAAAPEREAPPSPPSPPRQPGLFDD